MKKIAKIIGIILVCFVATMIILPVAFKGKIKEIVISEANKLINTEFGFDNLKFSLFSEFPQASIGIEYFWVHGKGVFAEDTLAYVGNVEVAVNLKSIFSNSGFDITKVTIKDTYLKAIVLEDGQANWDIMHPSKTEEPEDTTTSTFRILLKKATVDNLNIIYDDRQGGMHAHINDIEATCQGDMASDRALLKLQSSIETLTIKMDDIPLLSKARIGANLNIDADFANNRYTLQKNSISINAIQARIDGWAALPSDAPISMDLQLNTSDIKFKEILSLIPAIYAKDFEDLKAEGTVSLHAYAKGEFTETTLPEFEAALIVKDGNFRYPSLPAGIDNIQIIAKASNPGGDIDLTEVVIEQLSLNMMNNPFAVTAQVKNPISDPDFALTAKGTLNLNNVKDVYPLEDIALNGVLKADINFGGRLSYIETEQYERFRANGTLTLQDMKIRMTGVPDMGIQRSTFAFTPRYLNLSETQVLIGENDIIADCRFENYMAFALKGETLKGQLNLKSHRMNLNDFMSSDETNEIDADENKKKETADSQNKSTSVFVIPSNIDFNMNVDMAEILFDNIKLNELEGKFIIKDGTADIRNLSMQTMGGNIVMNGSYSTAKSKTSPELKASFALKGLSFAQTYKELNIVRQMAPIFENLNGNFSGQIAIDTELDETMSPELQTLTANGGFNTQDLNLSGVNIIDKIADATGRNELKNINVKDLNIDFTIQDGRIQTKPFDINMGNISLNLSGTTGLDQTIKYVGKLKLPESTSSISSINLKIGGTFSSPKITIDTQSMARQATEAVTKAAAGKAVEAVSEKLGLDISNAENQKEELIKAAEQAAQKLVNEAEKQKINLVSKAGNHAIKKLAAEKAGDALINEAKEQGAKLITEAEKKGNELIEKAKDKK